MAGKRQSMTSIMCCIMCHFHRQKTYGKKKYGTKCHGSNILREQRNRCLSFCKNWSFGDLSCHHLPFSTRRAFAVKSQQAGLRALKRACAIVYTFPILNTSGRKLLFVPMRGQRWSRRIYHTPTILPDYLNAIINNAKHLSFAESSNKPKAIKAADQNSNVFIRTLLNFYQLIVALIHMPCT